MSGDYFIRRGYGRVYYCDEPTEGPCTYTVAESLEDEGEPYYERTSFEDWYKAAKDAGAPSSDLARLTRAQKAGTWSLHNTAYLIDPTTAAEGEEVFRAAHPNLYRLASPQPVLCGEIGWRWTNFKGWRCEFHGEVEQCMNKRV